ncbi:hypothetical protein SAMN04487928_10771 [Butyrivibrio proteoclasticus]|uniref:HTH cro/C1-type domain-containing protein n=1 Tax=Butyrivibrio proteoclasticus TaxID=43305 RepID=A0A1I5SUK5_9FIRM|nr:helix-turn-helix transcriptional regulator [Butyrivibrio proteoclasticus]SFP74445.1 hypothetical protein SAMN04487928_10771 [Butyrivibrio proteoclasticus]
MKKTQTKTDKQINEFRQAQKDLGDAVKEARESAKKKVTQEGLAEKSFLESESIKRIERGEGNPRYSTHHPLVRNLDMNPYKIFYREKYDENTNLMDLIHYLMTNCSDAEAKKLLPFVKGFINMFHSENAKDIE